MNLIFKIVHIDNIFLAVCFMQLLLMRNFKYYLRLHLTFMNNTSISEVPEIDVVVLRFVVLTGKEQQRVARV